MTNDTSGRKKRRICFDEPLVAVSAKLPGSLYDQVDELVYEQRTTWSNVIRDALAQYLEKKGRSEPLSGARAGKQR